MQRKFFNNHKLNIYEMFACYIVFFIMAVGWSAYFPSVLGIKTALYYVPCVLILFILVFRISKIGIYSLVFLSAFYFIFTIYFLLTLSIISFNRFILLPVTIFICWFFSSNKSFKNKLVELLSVFSIIGVLLCTISFIYAFLGGDSSLTFSNIDGRSNHLFLFSLSNAVHNNVIRTGFIYDEPGAFSFLLFIVVSMREILLKNRKISILLIVGGLTTLSLTHVLLSLVYFIFILNFKKKIIVCCFFIPLAIFASKMPEFEFFYNRFEVNDAGLSGDNRSKQIVNFMNAIKQDAKIIFLGDYQCHFYSNNACDWHGDISSSPVTPLYRGGLLYLFIQLFVHAVLLYCIFKNKHKFSAVALFLLLLQRPFFEAFGYSFLIFFLFSMLVRR